MKKDVAIIMGSSSDLKVMRKASETLKSFGVSFHEEIVSAHRTPEKMQGFAKNAGSKGFKVIIAGAGGAAHLPGMVASLTTLPVIGVPVALKHLSGLDSVLSILQMPRGVPVATVAIDNATNAALLALRILAVESPDLEKKLLDHQSSQEIAVEKMNEEISSHET